MVDTAHISSCFWGKMTFQECKRVSRLSLAKCANTFYSTVEGGMENIDFIVPCSFLFILYI